ncbi:MAG TPA: hypothetical protein VFV80_01010 [Geminicoccaceae bacterium]|nr:hypothetical protein [Geminicoccaceae bacterium]
MQSFTHEQYIHAVRAIAVARLSNEEREAALDAKLVYGAGSRATRGVTYFGCWKNGHDHAFAEICAFGEDSPIQVAGTTLHELAHVIAGPGAGHGKAWLAACKRLGLLFVRAAGTKYSPACFAPEIREAILQLPKPTDGKPTPFGGIAPNGTPLQLKIRPCGAGIGVKGGKSRGAGSGSRLRKFTCGCGVIARVARDEFAATCNLCDTPFKRADAEAVTRH